MGAVRLQIDVRGRVQGVGFRPFVYRLATELGLAGTVANNPSGVLIEVEGPKDVVEAFTRRLRDEAPPLAVVERVSAEQAEPLGRDTFVILASKPGVGDADARAQEAHISPDAAVCPDCLGELRDPSDRRYGYPFINCTNCGPRYSIIHGVPYDRPNTTMSRFVMCPACQAEYDDPGDRRFHAQPNACPDCGPKLSLVEPDGKPVEGDPVVEAAKAIQAGSIVAVKGLGGFHLACRADDDAVVRRLRERKLRESKPFAVMVADLAAVQRICEVSEQDVGLLESPAAPIVLLPRRPDAAIAPVVAPDTGSYGVMLPYTPLHHLLFDQGLGPLVMTSGNPSDEPLCAANAEALRRLAPLTDLLLMHDRDICARLDDSVVVGGIDPPIPLRRARGYVPTVVTMPEAAAEPILALGGDLKSTFCVLDGRDAMVSEHLGELSSAVTYRHYVASIERLGRLLRVAPRSLVCDLHPGYQSTAHARSMADRMFVPLLPVQHHHAHVVSCTAENGVRGPVVGIACDGTGYGPDVAIWGCEVLLADEAGFERAGHLRYFALPGGDAGARQTWRPAVSLLGEMYGQRWREAVPEVIARVGREELVTVERMLERRFNCPATSSLGRLFDAVAFLLGLADENRHEAQAAMALEAAAAGVAEPDPLSFEIESGQDGGPLAMNVLPALRTVVERRAAGGSAATLAAAFHATVAAMLAETAARVAERAGLEVVALSGGCFLNRLLTRQVRRRLTEAGLRVLTHRRVPPGDGGISLGQAVIAARRLAQGAN